jgi:hypothetical protein
MVINDVMVINDDNKSQGKTPSQNNHETRQDKTTTRQDDTRHDKTRHNKTRQVSYKTTTRQKQLQDKTRQG